MAGSEGSSVSTGARGFELSCSNAEGQLLGHSMGAAPILSASPVLQSKGYQVPGVIVLDVVEGVFVMRAPNQ